MGHGGWGSGIAMAVGGGVIMALSAAVRRRGWPFRVWPALYACLAAIPVVVALVVLLVVTNFRTVWSIDRLAAAGEPA